MINEINNCVLQRFAKNFHLEMKLDKEVPHSVLEAIVEVLEDVTSSHDLGGEPCKPEADCNFSTAVRVANRCARCREPPAAFISWAETALNFVTSPNRKSTES